MIEVLYSERVFTIRKAKNGRGELYGSTYFPKEMIGQKFLVMPLDKEQKKQVKKVSKKELNYF